ncbi:glycosyltransferase [Paenibacillus wenxiniae]|uniref:Glycosyltransferase n=1 Tax=Paenibacillus wenxiniae TaxID=1636843 RepID=A0ABW4RF44_9BACL
MIITTSICANYLPKAIVLARSIKETNPEVRFILCLLERNIHPAAQNCSYFDDIVLGKDLGFEQFDKFIFKHAIVEASTAIKGQLFRYLFQHYPDEHRFVYLDPDIKVYGQMHELNDALNEHAIVLTPHLCHPEDIMDAVMDNELSALQHGVFNLGFLALARSEESLRFADWWASRLEMFCYDDIPRGIFTDQKWIDLAPCYFDVHIFKHPGYNVAPWNLSKRKLELNSEWTVNGQPLRFFHYSGFDSGANEGMINKYVPDRSNAVYTLRDEYVHELEHADQSKLGHTDWSYDFYMSGERIERESRLIYRDTPEMPYRVENPFALSNDYFKRYISVEQIAGNVIKQGKKLLKRLVNR